MVFLRGLPWRRRYPPHAITNGAALKRELITRWRHDRKAYAKAKTGFVLDALADAAHWAAATDSSP
jgi:hypothetical protein